MDIDTTPPTSHHEQNRPSMQLDIPSPDQVMMEVDPDVPASSPSASGQDAQTVPPNTASTSLLPNNALSHQWFHTQSPTKSFEHSPSPSRSLPTPPSAIISASDVASWPKLKLDQLFIEWFSRPESQTWISSLLQDLNSANGKSSAISFLDFPNRSSRSERSQSQSPGRSKSPASRGNRSFSPRQAPSSPVSKLFSSHIPFDDAESSPQSPPATPMLNSPSANSNVNLQSTTIMKLGQSGNLSPIRVDHTNPLSQSPTSSPNSNSATDLFKAALAREHEKNQVQTSPLDAGRVERDIVFTLSGKAPAVADGSVISEKAPNVQSAEESLPKERATILDQQALNDSSGTDSITREQSSSVNKSCFEERLSESDKNTPEKSNLSQGKVGGEEKLELSNGDIEKIEKSKELSTTNDDGVPTNTTSTDVPDSAENAGGLPPIAPHVTTMSDTSSQQQAYTPKRKAIPKFYFPCGRDADAREKKEYESMIEFFKSQKAQRKTSVVNRTEIAQLVVEVVGLPSYFASIIFSNIVEQFPRDNNVNGDENMKDVEVGEDGSSSSCVSGMEPRAMTISSEEPWRTNNPDTKMADGDSGGGDMKDIAGSSADGKSTSEKEDEYITEKQMTDFYNARCAGKSREMRLFQTLLGRARRNYLVPSDFKPLMRALLMCHQGLAFLHATPEFQQRYSETVIERIYFGCTRQHNGRLTLADIKRCKLLDTLMTIDDEEDINRERRYFSYEHFYVLYCRFWELDANHDLQIDKEDLMRYSSHSLTTRIVERIFSGHARPLDAPQNAGYMSYTDFIWFCLSEEDKTSDTAIDYWFRCVDMDGDGIITMYDMEYFYKEQLHRMESFGHEPVQIKDILCQLLDMISPNISPPMIRRRDLKKCRLAGNFFNILFNLNKFFTIEARDPLQIRQEHATPQLTDWDRFAALEYLRLSADEEGDEDESWEEVGDTPNPLLAGEAPF